MGQGRSQRGQGPRLHPNRRLSGTFTEKAGFVGTSRSVPFIYAKNALAAEALPRTPLGELTTEMESGRPGHGPPGRRVNILGQVGSGHGSVSNTHDPVFWPGFGATKMYFLSILVRCHCQRVWLKRHR